MLSRLMLVILALSIPIASGCKSPSKSSSKKSTSGMHPGAGAAASEQPRTAPKRAPPGAGARARLVPRALERITPHNAKRLVRLARLGRGGISTLVESADGRLIAVATSSWVIVYDAATLSPRHRIPVREDLRGANSRTAALGAVALSTDGSLLAMGRFDGSVRVVRLASGKTFAHLGRQRYAVHTLAFSPDGKHLAVGDNGPALVRGAERDNPGCRVRLWSLPAGKRIATMVVKAPVASLAFDATGKHLAFGTKRGGVQVRRVADGGLVRALVGPRKTAWRVAFSTKAAVVAGVFDSGDVIQWGIADGKRGKRFDGGEAANARSDVSADLSRVLKLAAPAGLAVHRIADGVLVRALKPCPLDAVGGIGVSPRLSRGGRWATAICNDGVLRRWEVASGKVTANVSNHDEHALPVFFSADGQRLFTHPKATRLAIWREPWSAGSAVLRKVDGGSDLHIAAAADLLLERNTTETRVRVSRLSDGKLLASWKTLHSIGGKTVLSANGKVFVTVNSESTEALVRRPSDGKVLRRIRLARGTVESAAISPDGRLLALGTNRWNVRMWRTDTGKVLRTLSKLGAMVDKLAFSADGKTLLSKTAKGEIRFWRRSDWKATRVLDFHKDGGWPALSPDGRLSATRVGQRLVLRDAVTGALRHRSRPHVESIYTIVHSPNGKLVATVHLDGTVGLWGVPRR